MSGIGPLNDVVLQATGTYIAGSSQQTVVLALKAGTSVKSRVEPNLGSGLSTEIRNYSVFPPTGMRIAADGTVQPLALHNCWTEAVWFFPALGMLVQAADPQVAALYSGQEARGGQLSEQLRFYRVFIDQEPSEVETISALSRVDVYPDSASFLPIFVGFDSHPEEGFQLSRPVEVVLSDYRSVNGVLVPFRIQKIL